MPGPGAHFFYTMSSGLALHSLSNGAFGPHHLLFYTVHAFFGPDIGVFGEFVFKDVLHYYPGGLKNFLMNWIHDPVGYMVCNALVFSIIYLFLSKGLLKWRWIRLYSQAPLTYIQCNLLGSAGGISHFFLDNLFEMNSPVLKAVLATGDTNKQVYRDPIIVLGFILTSFFALFFMIFRSETTQSQPPSTRQSSPSPRSIFAPLQSLLLSGTHLLNSWTAHAAVPRSCVPRSITESMFARFKSFFPELWCLKAFVSSSIRKASVQMSFALFLIATIYVGYLDWFKTTKHMSGIGEEADVGVVIFMAKYFIVPHLMCILAMHYER